MIFKKQQTGSEKNIDSQSDTYNIREKILTRVMYLFDQGKVADKQLIEFCTSLLDMHSSISAESDVPLSVQVHHEPQKHFRCPECKVSVLAEMGACSFCGSVLDQTVQSTKKQVRVMVKSDRQQTDETDRTKVQVLSEPVAASVPVPSAGKRDNCRASIPISVRSSYPIPVETHPSSGKQSVIPPVDYSPRSPKVVSVPVFNSACVNSSNRDSQPARKAKLEIRTEPQKVEAPQPAPTHIIRVRELAELPDSGSQATEATKKRLKPLLRFE